MRAIGWSATHPSLGRGPSSQPNHSLAALAPLRCPAEALLLDWLVLSPGAENSIQVTEAPWHSGSSRASAAKSAQVPRFPCHPLSAIVRDYYLEGL